MSLVDELKSKTVFELRSYAKQNGIDIFGVSTKADILEIILNFVPKETKPKAIKQQPKEKVAVYSLRNLHWTGVGALTKGYNIISKEDSEKWTRHNSVRFATPQEVAAEYGVSNGSI
jgi:hypothetical protein